ncbi:hypothetical protein EDB81DRAFT_915985 [Dactylonectria macrodidyma]|uniref:C2H2-type domain-containing protein n=1 Tax=Dactylonectria macrodidyma TaxID=307937 RepID=A0A9P9DDU1_9HYPO|nr:hypothetical protein EDB81DRAFT_915985 [Dactylonectria macrodidyma]
MPIQPPVNSLEEIHEEFDLHEADAWLAGLTDDYNEDWLRDTVETDRSPPTSMATETRTDQGNIYKACRCPSHQDVYSNWPTQDAELTIAQCMKMCMYCGKDFPTAAELRKHIRKRVEYAQRNITVRNRPNYPESIPHKQHRRRPTLMTGIHQLRILQYNVQKSRDVVLVNLFQGPRVLKYDILAIQEPWRNRFIATMYHPLKSHFQLPYLDNAATRVCFYISKRMDPGR